MFIHVPFYTYLVEKKNYRIYYVQHKEWIINTYCKWSFWNTPNVLLIFHTLIEIYFLLLIIGHTAFVYKENNIKTFIFWFSALYKKGFCNIEKYMSTAKYIKTWQWYIEYFNTEMNDSNSIVKKVCILDIHNLIKLGNVWNVCSYEIRTIILPNTELILYILPYLFIIY